MRSSWWKDHVHGATTTKLQALFLVVLLFTSAVLFGFMSAGGEPARGVTTTPPAAPQAQGEPTRVATATPAPEATRAPDRTSCDEIRGTAYRSDSEQSFYLTNCQPTPVPSTPVAQPPAIPGSEVAGERWILVDIANQTATAMIGQNALHTALVTTGKEGWETPRGTWRIEYRVANETMTSQSIGAEEEYILKDVLYTQYFTTVGHALHLNYWRPDSYFGNIPSSHGCVGMRLADAEFFWRFAGTGTRVTIV